MDSLNQVLANYEGLAKPFELTRLEKGHVATVWVVTSNECKHVLKSIDRMTPLDRVVFITESQDYMASGGFAPSICRTIEGRLFCQYPDGYHILSKYVHGDTLSISDLDEKAPAIIGEFLGRVHSYYSKFVSHSGCSKKLSLTHSPQNRIQALIDYHQNVSQNEFCLESLRYKNEELDRFEAKDVARFYNLPQQVVHGDFYVNNLRFDANKEIVALLDYDQSCEFFRAYELMRALVFTVCSPEKLKREEFPEKHLAAFLTAYLNSVDLSAAEVKDMIDLYCWVLLSDTVCFEPSERSKSDFTNLVDFGEYRMAVLHWMAKHKSQFRHFAHEIWSKKQA